MRAFAFDQCLFYEKTLFKFFLRLCSRAFFDSLKAVAYATAVLFNIFSMSAATAES